MEIKEKGAPFSEMEFKFYVVFVQHASIEDNVPEKYDHDYPRMYLRVQHTIEFDTFTATHGPGTYVDDYSGNKRKSLNDIGPPAKQQKTIYPAYFIPELAHVVAMCDEKLPFVAMAQELARRKIPHSGLQVEANATSLVLKLLALPEPIPNVPTSEQAKPDPLPVIEKSVWNALQKRLLSVSIRCQVKNNHSRYWTVEMVFFSTPLQSRHHREQGKGTKKCLLFSFSHLTASVLWQVNVEHYIFNMILHQRLWLERLLTIC